MNNVVIFQTQMLGGDGSDASQVVTDSADRGRYIQFSPKVNIAVFDPEELAAVGISRNNLINLGLGVPILNEAEDAFLTTPTLPS